MLFGFGLLLASIAGVHADITPDPFNPAHLIRLGLSSPEIARSNPRSALNLREAYDRALRVARSLPYDSGIAEAQVDQSFAYFLRMPYNNPAQISAIEALDLDAMEKDVGGNPERRLDTVDLYMRRVLDRRIEGWRSMASLTAAFSRVVAEAGVAAYFSARQKVDLLTLFSVGIYLEPKVQYEFWLEARAWMAKYSPGREYSELLIRDQIPRSPLQILLDLISLVPVPNGAEKSPWGRIFRQYLNFQIQAGEGLSEDSVKLAQFASALSRENPNALGSLSTLEQLQALLVREPQTRVPPELSAAISAGLSEEAQNLPDGLREKTFGEFKKLACPVLRGLHVFSN